MGWASSLAMKYFFEVHDGQAYTDDEGTDLPSLQQARVEAIRVLADFLSEKPEKFWRAPGFALTVQNDRRATLFTLHLTVDPDLGADNDHDVVPLR